MLYSYLRAWGGGGAQKGMKEGEREREAQKKKKPHSCIY